MKSPQFFGVLRRSQARLSLALVVLLCLTALAAPWVAPFEPAEQLDPAGSSTLPPLAQRVRVTVEDERGPVQRYVEVVNVGSDSLAVRRQGVVENFDVDEIETHGTDRFLLGTDRLGRDLLSRIIHGARTSLAVGILSAALALTLGVLVGSTAALSPPVVDSLVMRTVDGLMAFPRLVLLLFLTLLFEPSTRVLILIIGSSSWMGLSRLVRAEVLSVSSETYVEAARSIGTSAPRLFLRHILPNIMTPIVVLTTLMVGDAIVIESALSFLGLGVQTDLPSWGRMVAEGRGSIASAWWISTFPGIAILITVLAFNLLGDSLRDELDPKIRQGAPTL